MANFKEKVNLICHPQLNNLEMINAHYKHKNFSKHCHESYTVSVIKTGVQKFFRSGEEHFAPADCIILVNADDVHNGQAGNELGWSYQAIYPLESHFNRLAEDIGWGNNFSPYFPDAVVYDPELAKQLRLLFACLSSSYVADIENSRKPFINKTSSMQTELLFNEVLIQLMIKHGKCKSSIKPVALHKPSLLKAKSYLHDYVDENVSLALLSEHAGISVFHLVRQFKALFGLTPHAYHIQQKLVKAKSLLKSGVPVVHTSLSLGFHDQSHFHRHFVNTLGISPGKYAKAVQNEC